MELTMQVKNKKIGFFCAYTPIQLIHAAGYTPYRILPISEAADASGSLIHDAICPQVKRILDRLLADDLPQLEGVVFVNSCDAMRRLADAWRQVGKHKVILLDLPVKRDERSLEYLAGELRRFSKTLSEWSGNELNEQAIRQAVDEYNQIALALKDCHPSRRSQLQELYNLSVSATPKQTLAEIDQAKSSLSQNDNSNQRLPLYLFGNVLADPEAFDFFEEFGVNLVADDLCTGSRQLVAYQLSAGQDVYQGLSEQILARPRCARTFVPDDPLHLAEQTLRQVQESGAKGAIAHVVKFCDPYLTRMPVVREVFKQAGMPLLVLEGDCSLRSLGQLRTRIEAFVEMLQGV
jgi:benzoyl-CoA reductase/2-hydroxyglutaryl-CoA dehydratase subunit BcrC/BadD/HgdB